MINKYLIEKTYLSIYIIAACFSTYLLLGDTNFTGELHRSRKTISDLEVILLSTLTILSLFSVMLIYRLLNIKRIKISKNYTVFYNIKYINIFIFFLLLIQLSFLLKTGIGKITVGEQSNNDNFATPIFSFLKPDPFIYLYYILIRSKSGFTIKTNKLFILNMIIFSLFKIMQGWTGFIFILFFIEMLFRQRKKQSLKLLLLPVFVIFIGGFIYQYAYVMKNQIRGNNIETISYIDGVSLLVNRLTMIPNSLGAYQNYDRIVSLYRDENIIAKEAKAFFRPIIPGSFMNKDFRNLNNNVMNSYTPDLNKLTSSDFGIVMYFSILYEASIWDFLISSIASIFLLIFAKIYFDTMAQYSGQFDFLLFLIIFKLIYTVSLENVFAQGFIPYIFITIVLILFKAINIKKRL